MSKTITMTIHQFMEIERGNLTLEDLNKENFGYMTFGRVANIALLILIFYMMPIASPLPVKTLAFDNSIVSTAKMGMDAMYITSTVLIEIMYEIIVSTAVAII